MEFLSKNKIKAMSTLCMLRLFHKLGQRYYAIYFYNKILQNYFTFTAEFGHR